MKRKALCLLLSFLLAFPLVACGEKAKPMGTEGLAYYILEDGTYSVAVGEAKLLEEIVVPASFNGKPVSSILADGFRACPNLRKITLPESLCLIGASAFEDCEQLAVVTVPSGVTNIGDRAFRGCGSLVTLLLPLSLATIGREALRDCTSLSDLVLPGSLRSVGWSCLAGCESLASLTIPFVGGDVDGEAPTHFGYLFGAPEAARQGEVIPSTLRNLTVIQCEKIDARAFLDCKSLVTVTLPASLKMLGEGAFMNCTSLAGLTLPSSLTRLEARSFFGCTSLGSLTVPASIRYVGEELLGECVALETLTVPFVGDGAEIMHLGYFFGGESSLENAAVVPASLYHVTVTGSGKIASYAFDSCLTLKRVSLTGKITEVGENAFRGCRALCEVALPDSLERLGDEAFRGCIALVTLEYASSPAAWEAVEKAIGWDAGCGDYEIIYMKG